MADRLKELIEKRAELFTKMCALQDLEKAEARVLTKDESAQWEAMNADLDKVDGDIEPLQAQNGRTASLEARKARYEQHKGAIIPIQLEVKPGAHGAAGGKGFGRNGQFLTDARRGSDQYADAFEASLKRGLAHTPQHFSSVLQVDSDTAGGFISASERFIGTLIKGVDDAVQIRQFATVYPASYGESLGFPTLATDVGDFAFDGEVAAAVEDTAMAFGKREFKIHPLQRKTIKASKRLIESRLMNAEQIVIGRANYSLARTMEKKYLLGTGAQQPLGLFVASANGIPTTRDISTGNSTTSISWDGLISAEGALKSAHRVNARWIFHRDALTQIRKLKTGDGVYLWQPGMTLGQPNTILNYPYLLSEYAPNTFTTGLYVGLIGDLSWYWIADALNELAVQVLTELYAPDGQNGYLFDKIGLDAMPVLSEAFARVKLA